MVTFTDKNNDLLSTNVDEAKDILNSGSVNFDVFTSDGESSLSASSIEIDLIENYYGDDELPAEVLGYYDPNFPGTVFIKDSGPYLTYSGTSANRIKGIATGDITATIVHETLHTAQGVKDAKTATLADLTNAIATTPGASQTFQGLSASAEEQVSRIVEEVIVRDAVDLIDIVVDDFSRSGSRGFTDIDLIIDTYGDQLTTAQKDLLADIIPDVLQGAQVEINGTVYGRAPDGTVGIVDPNTGGIEDLPATGGFIDQFLAAGQELIDDVVDAAIAVGNAIVSGLEALGNAINDAVNAIGNFFNDVIDLFSGNNDPDEDTASDDDNGKPLILDLDGDGIEINVRGDVSFDMDGDGFLEKTSWVDEDDAFIVIDLNADGTRGQGDGVIDQTAEVILTEWVDWNGATDLQALATFDQWAERGGNNDGVLDSQDTIWSELRVWQDSNQNGVTDAGELLTLGDHNITEIRLVYDDGTDFSDTSNDREILNNVLLGEASVVWNGVLTQGAIGDVSLSYSDQGTKVTDTALGRSVEFEDGTIWNYFEADATTAKDFDLTSNSYQGAVGDGRDNILTALNTTYAVSIDGADGNDTITGGQEGDILIGSAGADQINGGLGDDLMEGGAGADVLNGDGGDDIASYLNSDSAVSIHLLNDTYSGGHATGDDLNDIENVAGSKFNDTINGTGLGNDIFAEDGNDKVYAHGGWDNIWLGDGNDTAMGDDGNDHIYGESGNDTLWGGRDNDTLDGGSGDDKIYGQHGVDVIDGGTGNDTIRAGGYDDTIAGGDGNDQIFGEGGNDSIDGGYGDDTLDSGGNSSETDVFVFKEDYGDDIVKRFTLDKDTIQFQIEGLSYSDLVIQNSGSDALITYDFDDTILIENISASALTADQFEFV